MRKVLVGLRGFCWAFLPFELALDLSVMASPRGFRFGVSDTSKPQSSGCQFDVDI